MFNKYANLVPRVKDRKRDLGKRLQVHLKLKHSVLLCVLLSIMFEEVSHSEDC